MKDLFYFIVISGRELSSITSGPVDTPIFRGNHAESLMEHDFSLKTFYEDADDALNHIVLKKKLGAPKKYGIDGYKHFENILDDVNSGITATATCDFDAVEEDMLSFATKDKITDIKTYTGGWWRGTCHGKDGRFPSNYVALDMN